MTLRERADGVLGCKNLGVGHGVGRTSPGALCPVLVSAFD